MRRITLALILALALCAGSSRAQEDAGARRAAAEDLLDAMHMKDNIEKSFAMMRQMMPAQMEKMAQSHGQTNDPAVSARRTDAMMEMLTKELSWDNLKDEYVTLYAETFTEEEMKGIADFFKSPAGQAYTSKQPELAKRSMELSQKMMMQIMPKLQAMAQTMSDEEKPERAPAPADATAPESAPAATEEAPAPPPAP